MFVVVVVVSASGEAETREDGGSEGSRPQGRSRVVMEGESRVDLRTER